MANDSRRSSLNQLRSSAGQKSNANVATMICRQEKSCMVRKKRRAVNWRSSDHQPIKLRPLLKMNEDPWKSIANAARVNEDFEPCILMGTPPYA